MITHLASGREITKEEWDFLRLQEMLKKEIKDGKSNPTIPGIVSTCKTV